MVLYYYSKWIVWPIPSGYSSLWSWLYSVLEGVSLSIKIEAKNARLSAGKPPRIVGTHSGEPVSVRMGQQLVGSGGALKLKETKLACWSNFVKSLEIELSLSLSFWKGIWMMRT